MLTAINKYACLEELTHDVVSNPKLLHGMGADTLSQLTSYAIDSDDFRVLALLTEIHTGIPTGSNYLPEWWLSDFHDDITEVKFEHQKNSKKLRWCDITLDDGELLTSEKHKPLLNAFKYWLIACDNPIENGGKLTSSTTASAKYRLIIVLINTILLNGEALKLSEFHLQRVTDEFWLKVLLTIAEHSGSISNDLYQTNRRIKHLLDSVDVPPEEVEAFKSKYPHVDRKISSEETILNLKDKVKACCWLHKQRFYAHGADDKAAQCNPKGNNTILTTLVFEGKILKDYLNINSFPELELLPTPNRTEYKAVPNLDNLNGSSDCSLNKWFECIHLINTNIDKSNIGLFNPVTSNVSTCTLQSLVSIRKNGRTKTLSPEFTFDLFRRSYELLKQFCTTPNEVEVNFWDHALVLLTEASKKSTKRGSNSHRPDSKAKKFNEALHGDLPHTELGHWLKFEAIDSIHTEFKEKGIVQFDGISLKAENRHTRIRSNESMLELFTVLQGAVQLLVGSVMARRQDELVKLKPFGNLIYINDDGKPLANASPYNEDGERWSLRFKVKKTGVKGKNLTTDRPIPLSIARFVWQLEQFNQQAIALGLVKMSDLALFNYIDSHTFKLRKHTAFYFNAAFDALCDYFETAIVKMDNGEYRRHYVRQHQLRRFFALVFFWSKGYENMEALRWMLAHSDLEHLHNYITEADTGAVLNSAKASAIVQSVINDKSMIDDLDEVEKLRKIIAERVTGDASKMLHIKTLDETVWDYEDEDEDEYQTVPHIKQLQAEQEIENEVLTLLENGSITLHPEFFTVQDDSGEDVRNFNLILKINELEGE
ncbi:integrase [uncultured Vibrio sp.]|uniref:integrase n=1 Tax=uncultured Vibrio sp. TaxID=114054 RepID=UPI00261FE6E8|nr:integrase [uncultured Vibrio sp.]